MLTDPWEYLPDPWRQAITNQPSDVKDGLQEIRLRVAQPVYLYGNFGAQALDLSPTSKEALELLLLRLADHSLYARLEEVRQGYLTLPGGHRVGIAGRAVIEGHQIATVRDISGLSIRRARAAEGIGQTVLDQLGDGSPASLLVASPPRSGKTTLIRDLARIFAEQGHITVIVDERSEIAGCEGGIPSYAIGAHADVLDGWPKAEGMTAALRSLSPEVLVVDELIVAEDFAAVWKARWSGVKVLASVHLGSVGTMNQNEAVYRLWRGGVFDALVMLSRRNGPGTIESLVRWADIDSALSGPAR